MNNDRNAVSYSPLHICLILSAIQRFNTRIFHCPIIPFAYISECVT